MVKYFEDINTNSKLQAILKKKAKKILLFTHITADNIGDQVIEICSSALTETVMKNLGFKKNQYIIFSVDAGAVNNRYLSIQYSSMPQLIETLISAVDLVIFGGAPMFNYKYEGFAERTTKTLNIIKKYNKQVIFSAIGIEDYEEKNYKCEMLKESINSTDVKMITTRDNFDALSNLVKKENIITAKVSDPAVFTFSPMSESVATQDNKKIGIFLIRGMAFKDNGINFSQDDAIKLWNDLAKELEKRGYDYEFLTSGSHPDESFIDRMTREFGLEASKCITNINTPEELIGKISSYSGIISCRLHPSIIAYSLKVPGVGLVWNNKVESFFESIDYPNRVITKDGFEPVNIVNILENAMKEGVLQDEIYLMSVYKYLFEGIKMSIGDVENSPIYTFEELLTHIPKYQHSDYRKKVNWKFSRLYRTFNNNMVTMRKRGIEIDKLKKEKELLEKHVNELQRLNEKKENRDRWISFLKKYDFKMPQKLSMVFNFDNPWIVMEYTKNIYFELKFHTDFSEYIIGLYIRDPLLISSNNFKNNIESLLNIDMNLFKMHQDDRGIYIYSKRLKEEIIIKNFKFFYEKSLEILF